MTICMLMTAFIGVLLAFFIPKGHGAPGAAKYLWGLHRHEWGDIHTVFSIILTALLVLHLVIHVDFLQAAFRRYMKTTFLVGSFYLVFLTAILMFVSMKISKRGKYGGHPDTIEGGKHKSMQSEIYLRGFERRENRRKNEKW